MLHYCKALEPTELRTSMVSYGVAQSLIAIPSNIEYAEKGENTARQGIEYLTPPMKQYFCFYCIFSVAKLLCCEAVRIHRTFSPLPTKVQGRRII